MPRANDMKVLFSLLGLVMILALILTSAEATQGLQPAVFAQPLEAKAKGTGTPVDRARVTAALRSSPVMFIENVGQFAEGAIGG